MRSYQGRPVSRLHSRASVTCVLGKPADYGTTALETSPSWPPQLILTFAHTFMLYREGQKCDICLPYCAAAKVVEIATSILLLLVPPSVVTKQGPHSYTERSW